MKKICNLRCYVAIGKQDYEDTSMWTHLRYCKPSSTEECITSWDNLCDLVEEHNIRNAELTINLLGKPVVKIGWADVYANKAKITDRNFSSVRVKWAAEPVNKIYSIKDLADLLPAEDFCEYLKDRGMEVKINC